MLYWQESLRAAASVYGNIVQILWNLFLHLVASTGKYEKHTAAMITVTQAETSLSMTMSIISISIQYFYEICQQPVKSSFSVSPMEIFCICQRVAKPLPQQREKKGAVILIEQQGRQGKDSENSGIHAFCGLIFSFNCLQHSIIQNVMYQ